MRKCLILFMFCCATPASAQLLLYDGFSPSAETEPPAVLNYRPGELLAAYSGPAPGTPLVGQHNAEFNLDWRSATPNNVDPVINPPGITGQSLPTIPTASLSFADAYPLASGLPTSAGNSVLFDHSQLAVARIGFQGGSIATGTVYWSGLFRVNTLGNLRSTVMLPGALAGVTLGSFNNSTGYQTSLPTALGSLLLIRPDFVTSPLIDPSTTTYQIGLGASSNNNDKLFADTLAQDVGDTVFIVGSYEIVANATNDISKMWINPDPASFGNAEDMLPAPTLSSSTLALKTGTDLTAVASFHLRNNNAIYENTNWQFDELRVGTNWASVTSILAPPLLIGDYNDDGSVDAADYAVWRDNLGAATLPDNRDPANTGSVDINDYNSWQANFSGSVGSGQATAIPEPAAVQLVLLALGAICLGFKDCFHRPAI